MDQRELICVGHILGAHGVKGWIRVFSNTSPRENILNYSPWLIARETELVPAVVEGRKQGKSVLARLDGIDDRTQAEALTGCQLYIEPAQLPQLEDGEFYWSDLIGLEVETLQAQPLGVVTAMMETGANDVMVINGERERLVPFVIGDIVREVDLEKGRLVVDWLPDY